MVCNNCNTLNPSHTKKCQKCGMKLIEEKGPSKNESKKAFNQAIDHKRRKENTFVDYSKNKTANVPVKKSSSTFKLLLLIIVIAGAYYIYDKESIHKYYLENEDIAPYIEEVSNTVAEYTSGIDISFKNAPKDEIPAKDSTMTKVKKQGRAGGKEYDYYKTMKEKNISQPKAPEDTIKYISSSDAIEAQKLLKKSKTDPNVFYGKDNKKMMLIPSQKFTMGNNNGSEHEKPEHTVDVPAFFMDVYEVTNGEFLRFLEESNYKPTGKLAHLYKENFDSKMHPIVDVSHEDAVAYASFYEKRLPTEAEWECAAKGGKNFAYATGDTVTTELACFNENIRGNPRVVGYYDPNNYGIYDMSGNVSEWVAGFMFAYPGNPTSSPTLENLRFSRGGSWGSPTEDVTTTRRTIIQLSNLSGKRGFRCVISK